MEFSLRESSNKNYFCYCSNRITCAEDNALNYKLLCMTVTGDLLKNVFQILIPPKGLLIKLKKEAENPKEVLDQVTC